MLFGFHGQLLVDPDPLSLMQVPGCIDTVHGIFEESCCFHHLRPADDLTELICSLTSDLTQFGFFTRQSLSALESAQPFDNAPLYALIHEQIYARG